MRRTAEIASDHYGDQVQFGSLLRSLSALLAMGYRRAPLPISGGLVRWLARKSGPDAALQLCSVVRRCFVLGDDALVLRELRRHSGQNEEAADLVSKESGEHSGSGIEPLIPVESGSGRRIYPVRLGWQMLTERARNRSGDRSGSA
jgi:hypothetical protein